MVNNSENLENIIAASPGLDKDPVAIGKTYICLYT